MLCTALASPLRVSQRQHLRQLSDSCTWRNGATSPPAPLQKRGALDDQHNDQSTAAGAKEKMRWSSYAGQFRVAV